MYMCVYENESVCMHTVCGTSDWQVYTARVIICKDLIEFQLLLCRPATLGRIQPWIAASGI